MSTTIWTVESGFHARPTAPVTVSWPVDLAPVPEGQEQWLATQYGNPIVAQLAPAADDGATLTWIAGQLQPRESRAYQWIEPSAVPVEVRETVGGVKVVDVPEKGYVEVTINGALQTRYWYRNVVRPYLYPWIGPHGASITRNWPMVEGVPAEKHDHPHHKSIWFGSHNHINGTDHWSETPGHGYKRHIEFEELTSGPVWGRIVSRTSVQSADSVPVLEERLSLTFYGLGQGIVQMDAELTLQAVHGEVRYSDTKEAGLFAVRVTSPMEADRLGRIENGVGAVGEAACWGKSAPWCHYSGPLSSPSGEVTVGIGVFDHPANPRYPTEWHVRNYGLMTANFFGLSDFNPNTKRDGSLVVPAGEELTFRYRMVSHPGSASEGQAQERFLEHAFGTKVSASTGTLVVEKKRRR
jgi:hypothetical protein